MPSARGSVLALGRGAGPGGEAGSGAMARPGAQAESEVPVTRVESPSSGMWVCSSGDILAQHVPWEFAEWGSPAGGTSRHPPCRVGDRLAEEPGA